MAKKRFFTQKSGSDHDERGQYRRELYTLGYHVEPIGTGLNQYNNAFYAAGLAGTHRWQKTLRMSTAADEMQIYGMLLRSRADPKRAAEYVSLLDRSRQMILVTATTLRTPPGWEGGKTTSKNGRQCLPRILLEYTEPVAEVFVPAGAKVVTAHAPFEESVDMANGLPLLTLAEKTGKHYMHFVINPDPDPDPVSGERDVAMTISFSPDHKVTPGA